MRTSVKDRLRHILNPLHVYCSLSYVLKRQSALRTARAYEKGVYKTFFRNFL
ncbi:MAG: hypothetical protein ACNS63_11445 [Candidatus Nitrospinota bacterium M3_3B_026]